MCVGLCPLVEEPGTAFFRKRRVPQIISQKGESSLKGKYIAKRILIAIPTFFGITLLAYLIMSMAPGSPLDALLADPRITPEELERLFGEVAARFGGPVRMNFPFGHVFPFASLNCRQLVALESDRICCC